MSDTTFREGVPAFVDAYDRLRDLIARDGLEPGRALPGEVALCEELGAERPAVQEALLLLAEDGFVRRDRAHQRWLVAAPRARGIGFADSFHRVLGDEARAVRRLHAAVEAGSSWTRQLLGTEQCLVWETVFAHEDTLLASTLEWVPVSAAPPGLLDDLDAAGHDVEARPTLLEALGAERRARLTPQLWRVGQVSRNSERLRWMELPLHGIPAALTVVLADGGRPVYLAKNLFDLGTFNLVVDQLGDTPPTIDLRPGGPE